MKYKNIIFDFGNVIGKFKGDYILGKFASTPEDYDILADAIFKNWVALDAGTIDYDQNAKDTIAELPDRLKDTARDFSRTGSSMSIRFLKHGNSSKS